jgi:transmembrane sensor
MVKRWRARSSRRIVTTVAVILVVGVGAVIWQPSFDFLNGYRGFQTDGVLTTELGEHRDITLASGPRVVLNTQTALTAHELPRATELELRSGEILVEAGSKVSKPLRVVAGSVAVQATQGTFSFRRASEGEYVVRVFIGEVMLQPASSLMPVKLQSGRSAFLWPGKLRIDGFAPERARRLLSWTTGKLIFDGESLDDIASEFNRYNRAKILIATPSIARLKIGGSFSATNPEGFAQKLEAIFNVRAVTVRSGGRGASIIVLKSRSVPGGDQGVKSAALGGALGV